MPKDGAGAGNWGGPDEEIRNAVRNRADDDEGEGDAAADAEESTPDAEPAAPAAPTFTLDEYLEMRNQKIANKEAFSVVNVRKVETDIKASVLTNAADEDYLVLGGLKGMKISKKEKKKETVSLDFTNAALQPRERDDRDERGGRGSRGGSRGGGGRGSGGAKIDIGDKSAFPSLG